MTTDKESFGELSSKITTMENNDFDEYEKDKEDQDSLNIRIGIVTKTPKIKSDDERIRKTPSTLESKTKIILKIKTKNLVVKKTRMTKIP
jgi:hypothetical protein